MALYGLLEVLQARNETPQPFSVDVYVNGTLAGTQTLHRGVADRAGSRSSSPRPGARAPTAFGWSRRAAARSTGRRARSYYDTQGAAGAQRQPAARHHPQVRAARAGHARRIASSIAKQPFDGRMNPGDVLTVRLTIAGSQRLALSDDRGSAAGRRRGGAGHDGVSDGARGSRGAGGGDRRSSIATIARCSSRSASTRAATSSSISSRRSRPGEFRAVPAQVAPMYVPDVSASSEPQTVDGDACRRERAMIAAWSRIAAWLALGAVARRGLYWLFLNTPESNVLHARRCRRCPGAADRCRRRGGRQRRRPARARRHASARAVVGGAARHSAGSCSSRCRVVASGGGVVRVDAWVVEHSRRDQRVVHRAVRLGRHQPLFQRRAAG